ncbi:B- and T-lymphocyte attenuator [Dicentrarchus labrax]|uniref:B- and T-lymphocyte attenuator n=1 Tax=Dicentrarchus labrax TaxID=13489 RepID=UPI0021F55C3F|nr:B- and T-lymphocyte attenuator [Dicentrarchus labrax]
MTGGFLSVPIMRPNHCWTILYVSIFAVLLLTLNADSEDSDCEIELRVRRHTVFNVSSGQDLKINCTVRFCNDSPPTVSWYKFEKSDVPVNVSSGGHIKTEWEKVKHLEGISYLIFKNIHMSDSGSYQCRSGLIMGHNINVSVNDADLPNVTQKTETISTSVTSDPPNDDNWMYVYTAAGIVAFVIMVIIISVASMQSCKGKSKKETQTDNQYMAIAMVEQPFPHPGLQGSPRGSPAPPPSRRSTRRKTPPSQPNELPLPGDNEHLYGRIPEDRERQRNTAEEEGSVVYAALNHQLPPRAAARPRRPMEECSEYAAIRVKDR